MEFANSQLGAYAQCADKRLSNGDIATAPYFLRRCEDDKKRKLNEFSIQELIFGAITW